MSRILLPLDPLYAAAVAAKNLAYDREWLRPQRLRWPVVSVGNLSVGGAGKTPLVIRLAELLRTEGLAVDVLSRGYGRSGTATERVDAHGDAARYGDEPMLITQSAGVSVFVGASRAAAGRLAEMELPAGARAVHLLDDGFQHRKLARAVDVVVVRQSDLDEALLPAGRLREPLRALRRASIVALRAEEPGLEEELRRRGIEAPVWWIERNLEIDPASCAFAFCGIAFPDEFFKSLAGAGVEIVERRAFRDHHRFSMADVHQLAAAARASQTQSFVTTEKDAVRLTPAMRAVLEGAAPLHVAKLVVRLRDEKEMVRDLLRRIGVVVSDPAGPMPGV